MALFWLSFADEKQFLGALIVEADSFPAAVTKSHLLNQNPGGEIMALEIDASLPQPPARYLHRLMDRAEVEAFDAYMTETHG